ncbi:carbohydrate porin [Pseudoalteromonas umbrosa]|uniref:carbohydrate porin n=1 Tax=Pseudoalteromonas umbrosa TaxID=3048489 RepID=UPI0024C405BA|nr:carbohydrate porin [Pseudoalteromonas sp. B95]MDK1290582.1 carbohydrate porin [Pseudoalteromonas sp. B95]
MPLTECKYLGTALIFLTLSSPTVANDSELAELKQQLQKLQQKIEKLEAEQKRKPKVTKPVPSIKVGGAVRTTLSHTSYDDDNKNRGGDFELDVFRLNFSGNIGGFGLNAEWRYFDYMTAVKYAYLYYDFAKDWQAQVGMTKVPFGNWPYNSHSWFFGTTYYVGLEDDHDMGILFKRKLADNWQLDLGFFKNDELGGVDGYVESRSDRYSYDIVGARPVAEGIYDDPTQPLGEYNTFAGRYGYHFKHKGGTTEFGVSGLMGNLHNGIEKAGEYQAWAVHVNANIGKWNLQLQHGEYDYDVAGIDRIAVGAYAFYDSIAAEATMSNFNVAYNMKVKLGPINALQFYNDFGIIYDKSDQSHDTWMNVTGVSMSAGAFFSYLDFVNAKNQPFVGGSIAGDSDDTQRRFNLNFGYYF